MSVRLLKRTMDAAFLNRVVNDPEVRSWLGGEGALDLTRSLANPQNIALVGQHGGFVVERLGPDLGDAHTQILPEGRGLWAVDAIREALRYVFIRTEITTLTTKVPLAHRGALLLVKQMGFQELFRRDDAFTTPDGERCPLVFLSLTFERWLQNDAVVLQAGELFHAQLKAAEAEWGVTLPDHPEDQAHDRAAGAAMLMAQAGNPARAVQSYNRWAALAGYPPIDLLSLAPLVLHVGEGVIVTNNDGEMEVLAMQRSA